MKVTIEKVPQGVRLTLDPGSQKPVVVTLTPSQIDGAVQLLQAAAKADVFKLTWDSE